LGVDVRNHRFKTNLSSRPERSVVEGPAVNAYFPVESNRQPDLTLAALSLMESTD
jgi:hypothetical protein